MYRPYAQRAVDQALLPQSLQLKGLGWPAGCHFLVSETTQVPIPEVLGFLRDHFLARSMIALKRSQRSLEAAVYDLKDYYDFLDTYKLKALEVGLSQIENYLNSMYLNDSPVTKKPFAISTVRRRASTVCAFYRWAKDCNLLKHAISPQALSALAKEEVRYETAGDRVQKPKRERKGSKVRFIPNEKLRRLLEAAGHLRIDVENQDEAPSARLRLMLECGLQAGMRRCEITGLEVDAVLKAVRIAKARFLTEKCPLELLRKGGRYKTVMLPVWLIRNLDHYIQAERSEGIRAGLRLDPEFFDHGLVFVNGAKRGGDAGKALAERYLSGPFATIQEKLGIEMGEAGSKTRYGVHALRHTYALLEYFSRKHSGDCEPWLYVQAQLGHSSLSTTTDIYLALAAEYEHEFGALLKEGMRQAKADG